jgi:predicted PurR-regulated permease PerM
MIYEQSVQLYFAVVSGQLNFNLANITSLLAHTPVAPYIDAAGLSQNASDIARSVSLFIFNNLRDFTQDVAVFIFKFFVMVYALFYFFKDGPHMLQRLMHLSPLGDNYELMLYERFTSTARATIKGSFIIGGIQGILGGLLFFIAGVQGAFIWGVILALFALIPGIGAFVVWLPIGIFLLATGNIWQGIMVLVVGAFVISLIDNILRPPLVGKDIQMHPVLILFSTLGGIALFGMSGLIIGPIVTALFLAVISIFDYFYQRELLEN